MFPSCSTQSCRTCPLGSVLVLEIGNEEPFPSRLIEGAPRATERPTEHLLDGQQRLTALWRGLNNNYEDRTYFLHLSPDEETGIPFYIDSVSRGRRKSDGKLMPLWADEPASQWERQMVPLHVLAPTEEARRAYTEWSRQAIDDYEQREEVRDTVELVRDKFSSIQLAVSGSSHTNSAADSLGSVYKDEYLRGTVGRLRHSGCSC